MAESVFPLGIRIWIRMAWHVTSIKTEMMLGHLKLSSHSRLAVPLWIIVKRRAIELNVGECKSFHYIIEQNWEKSECFELMTVC